MKMESVSAAAGRESVAQSVAVDIIHAEWFTEVPQDQWWRNRPCVSFHSCDAAISSQLENILTKRAGASVEAATHIPAERLRLKQVDVCLTAVSFLRTRSCSTFDACLFFKVMMVYSLAMPLSVTL